MNRTDLLTEIYAGRTRLEAVLVRFTPEQMTEPDLPGGWSIKDLLAHIGWWEIRVQEIYQDLAAGKTPLTPETNDAVDAQNAQIQEQFRARDLPWVRQYEQDAYRSLLDMAETMPEADLFDPQRFAWMKGLPFVEWVLGNSSGHYDEHLPNLEGLLAEDRGALRPPAPTPGDPHPTMEAGQMKPAVRSARAFLESAGRDIDRALFDFRFGTEPVETVLGVLSRYQNPDGGFTGLEVDIAAPQSNPFATELALAILTWIDAPRDHPVVQRVLAYLELTQDEDGSWRFAPEVYQHALAPWFQNWQWPNMNPTCTTAGLLKGLGLGSDRLHARAQALFDQMANPQDLLGNDFYAARPYDMYLQTEWAFPQADFYRWGVAWWLVRQHLTNPEMDATHFMQYVPRPDSAIAKRLPADILQAKLNQLVADQQEDGGWPTPYSPNWRPWVTIQNLFILRAHGRI